MQTVPSSFDIGFLHESFSFPRRVGNVKEILCWPTDVDVLRMARTEATSSTRCSAACRLRASFVGGGGRVDWCSCFARRRSKRVGLVPVGVSDRTSALGEALFTVIPVLRSSSLRCPFASKGEILTTDGQVPIVSNGKLEMNCGGFISGSSLPSHADLRPFTNISF